MPLHLLGKKSWNVYNLENVARVQRDEAQAKAREEEDERLMQEIDAERRIKILRGERPPTPPAPFRPSSESATRPDRKAGDDTGHLRKRRRIAGEDDTDRDIRYAREDAAHAIAKQEELALTSRKSDKTAQAPILDAAGHINLFPAASAKSEKNPEAEAENARKKRSYEDQYTMRFSNAAGFKETIGQKPWYSSGGQDAIAPEAMPEKNVWGNEDPRRKERERARMDVNDPLAAMKRGVRQLKSTEQERKRWNDNKRKEIESLMADEIHQSRHRRKRSTSVDSLEGFKLDAPDKASEKGRSSHRHHRRHRDSSRNRSRDRSPRRSSHRRSSHRSHRDRHDDVRAASRHSRKLESKNHS
ncbi:uncharacterized protein N7446_008191 [Penicillium canescens]|uniref:CBF1-interacting co-repressor CIR N-terminal domain-containing protein n=1 Tax=Penicillium canescens TaxID=5083 RepID=A0AAD6INF3_PENCN|nr:uncharacterized protein N7446_008191 [Penicillium canescens]KAJ6033518.1 hypothetical protein N7444_011289 [Penicillium canescens]KAJ6057291.1 hypothetical protein N7460_000565 [Penicillium canescens]KAJ6058608.1 hypothetical protein N7446_008191 [Penicillium canescens]